MITLTPLPADSVARVLHLELRDDQRGFVHPIQDMVREIKDGLEMHAVDRDGQTVGFFKIDVFPDKDLGFVRPCDLNLRGFLIGAQYQRQGIASAALAKLPDYLRTFYPAQKSVVLTVNATNPHARHVYLTGGFTDTGEVYHGGNSGPQNVLRLDLQT